MIELIFTIIQILIVLGIFSCATWLLINRLLKKEPKYQAFKEWIKHVFEALWGL